MLCFCLTATAKDVRFVQVTEAMYSPNNIDSINKCVEDINTLKNVDFVVFTGDNISTPRKDLLRAFLKSVKKIKAPVYVVIGDRDVSKEKGLNKDSYREECFKYLGWRQSLKPNYVFKKNGMVFIVVDGAKEFVTANNGYYKQTTLDWLDEKLTDNKNKKVVLIQHFPIIKGSIAEKNTYKSALYQKLLEKHDNILAIISGHFGINQESSSNNVFHIITPSYSTTGNYKIFDIPESKDFVYTQLRHVE